jgi:hypothetical protein
MVNEINFIGVGFPKCATTWLTHCLYEHPEISIPKLNLINEYNYFHNDYKTAGIKPYLGFFKGLKGVKGEMSAEYVLHPEVAPIIKKHFPNVKIIIQTRPEKDRVKSLDRFNKEYGVGSKKSSKIKPVNQEKLIDIYKKNFKQVLVIPHKDVLNSPEKVLKKTYKFLNVNSDFIPPSLYKKHNQKTKTKFKSIRRLINFFQENSRRFPKFRNFLKRTLHLD